MSSISFNKFLLFFERHHLTGYQYPHKLAQFALASGMWDVQYRNECSQKVTPKWTTTCISVITDFQVVGNLYFVIRMMSNLFPQDLIIPEEARGYNSILALMDIMGANRVTLFNFSVILMFFALIRAFMLMKLDTRSDVFLKMISCWYFDYVLPANKFQVNNGVRSTAAKTKNLAQIQSDYKRWFDPLSSLFPAYFNIPKLVDYVSLNDFSMMPNLTIRQKLNALLLYHLIELGHFLVITGTRKFGQTE